MPKKKVAKRRSVRKGKKLTDIVSRAEFVVFCDEMLGKLGHFEHVLQELQAENEQLQEVVKEMKDELTMVQMHMGSLKDWQFVPRDAMPFMPSVNSENDMPVIVLRWNSERLSGA